MIKLGVIGLGTIFAVQIKALLELSEEYVLTALCDKDPQKRAGYNIGIPVYGSSAELYGNEDVDAVLIATPPATHYALAHEGLRAGKHILLEKPAVLSMDELEELNRTADANGVLLHIAYHASFAKDLEWFLRNREKLAGGCLKAIECGFYDPYMQDGAILAGKRPLGGCFIDSGVNALSVCARLVPLCGFELENKNEVYDDEAAPLAYHADHRFSDGNCTITIHTGWDLGLNQKTTLLQFEGTEERILLDHSSQSVVRIGEGKRETVFTYSETERLLTHYLGVFRNFETAYKEKETNRAMTGEIHRLLLS